jgi:hypothetical protein
MRYTVNQEQVTWRILDGEAVIINNETSYYYSLNKTGAYLWELLVDDALTLEEMVQKLSDRYRRSQENVSHEVRNLLDQLLQERLVKEN